MTRHRILLAVLVFGVACHGFHRAQTAPRCDGDNTLLVANASNTAVDVYFSAAGSKSTAFLGEAAVGNTELELPLMLTNNGYRFEARRRDATAKTGKHIPVNATRVTFRVVCHPR